MDLVNLIVWVIVGAVAGWLASIVMKTNAQQGFLQDVIVGVIGAFIGGFVLNALGVGGAVTGLNIAKYPDGLYRRRDTFGTAARHS
ncbi:MAG: GlsB/YeaQ/YmgE family stress response membrane protein [Anaerolineae bacterium]